MSYYINDECLIHNNKVIAEVGEKYQIKKTVEELSYEKDQIIYISDMIEYQEFIRIKFNSKENQKDSVYDYIFHNILDDYIESVNNI